MKMTKAVATFGVALLTLTMSACGDYRTDEWEQEPPSEAPSEEVALIEDWLNQDIQSIVDRFDSMAFTIMFDIKEAFPSQDDWEKLSNPIVTTDAGESGTETSYSNVISSVFTYSIGDADDAEFSAVLETINSRLAEINFSALEETEPEGSYSSSDYIGSNFFLTNENGTVSIFYTTAYYLTER